MFSTRTAYDVSVYFDGKFQAHPKTEYPMLGYNYVSGVWKADGLRMVSILETGGKNVFQYQWLEGQDAYLVNLTMYHPKLGLGTSIAKWERLLASPNATSTTYKANHAPRFPPAFVAASVLLLAILLAASIFGYTRGRVVGSRLARQSTDQPSGAEAVGSKRAVAMV